MIATPQPSKGIRFEKYNSAHGFSYIEIIISMALISVFILGLTNTYFSAKKNISCAKENYLADIALENILNIAEAEFDLQKSISNILNNHNQDLITNNLYQDKFNFNIRLNEIDKDFEVNKNSLETFNPDNENLLLIDTKIIFNDSNLYDILNIDSNTKRYLITVDLYNKEKHKFLGRIIKIIYD